MSLPAAAVSAPAEMVCLGPTPKLVTLDTLDVFAQKVVCQQVTSELLNGHETEGKQGEEYGISCPIFSKDTFANEKTT